MLNSSFNSHEIIILFRISARPTYISEWTSKKPWGHWSWIHVLPKRFVGIHCILSLEGKRTILVHCKMIQNATNLVRLFVFLLHSNCSNQLESLNFHLRRNEIREDEGEVKGSHTFATRLTRMFICLANNAWTKPCRINELTIKYNRAKNKAALSMKLSWLVKGQHLEQWIDCIAHSGSMLHDKAD